MNKSTFYGLAGFCGGGSLLLGFLLWELDSGVSCSMPKSAVVEQDFMSIHAAMKTYYINARRPPTTAQGLDALVNEPTTGPKPKRWTQVMRKVPADPWGVPYRYALLEPKDREWRRELRSAGQDGVFGNGDDLTAEEESGGSVNPEPVEAGEKADLRPSF